MNLLKVLKIRFKDNKHSVVSIEHRYYRAKSLKIICIRGNKTCHSYLMYKLLQDFEGLKKTMNNIHVQEMTVDK